MNWQRDARSAIGNQKPVKRVIPSEGIDDSGLDAVWLSDKCGLTLDPWQELVLTDWLRKDDDGQYVCSSVGLSVPRQNGKNAILEARELYGMVELGEKFLHTAHEVKTARKAFRRIASFFENPRKFPELACMVKEIRRTNGQEAIELENGGSVEFVARSKNSARGYTVDVLVCDEAQEYSDDAQDALLPTISAAPKGNPQTIYTGTPPSPSMVSEVFKRFRANVLAGDAPRDGWHEWSADPSAPFDDMTQWAVANPGLGLRLSMDAVASERSKMSEESFGRERLGIWGDISTQSIIDAATWARCADMLSQPVDRLTLGVDIQPDRSSGSIAVAGQRADGKWHVEVIDNRNQVGWIVDRVVGIYKRQPIRTVVLDARGPAISLADALEAKGVKLTVTRAENMASACGLFYDAVMEDELRHLDTPVLNSALGAARRRSLGDAWAWTRKNSMSDIAPLVACTLALFGAKSEKVKKRRSKKAVFV